MVVDWVRWEVGKEHSAAVQTVANICRSSLRGEAYIWYHCICLLFAALAVPISTNFGNAPPPLLSIKMGENPTLSAQRIPRESVTAVQKFQLKALMSLYLCLISFFYQFVFCVHVCGSAASGRFWQWARQLPGQEAELGHKDNSWGRASCHGFCWHSRVCVAHVKAINWKNVQIESCRWRLLT